MVNFLEFFLLFDQSGAGKGVKGWVTAGVKIHGTSVRYITSEVVEKNGDIFIFELQMGKPLAMTNKICNFSGYISLRGNTVRKYKDSLRLIYRVYAKQLSLYRICEGPIKFNYFNPRQMPLRVDPSPHNFNWLI